MNLLGRAKSGADVKALSRVPPTRRASTWMIVGQVVGQLANMSVMPLLTRVYGPDELGPYQAGAAIAMIALPVVTLRAELVIPSFAHDESAIRIIRLVRWICVSLAVMGAAAMWVSQSTPGLGDSVVVFVICLIAATTATATVDNARLIRIGDYSRLAIRNGLFGILGAVLQVCVALAGLGVAWLALAFAVSRILSIVLSRSRARLLPTDRGAEPRPYGVKRASSSMLSGLVAAATGQVLTVSASGLGFQAVAYVGTSQRIAGAPLGFVGQALSQMLQASVAPRIRAGIGGLARRLVRQISVLGVGAGVLSVAMIVLAPRLAVPVLGEGWEVAGTVTAVLAVPLSMQLVVGPVVAVLPMLGMEVRLLGLQVVRLVLVAAPTMIMATETRDVVMVAAAFGAGTIIGYVLLIAVVLRASVRYDRDCAERSRAISTNGHV